jgi:hypothetical protein
LRKISLIAFPCAAQSRLIRWKVTMENRCFPIDLPCPTPLPGAVEGGVFGMTTAGPLCPDESEIREITEEHARQMISLLAGLKHFQRCERFQLDPDSAKSLSPQKHAALAPSIQREIADYTCQYQSCVVVYELAFGQEASKALDAAVERFVDTQFPQESPKIQRGLF